MATSPSTMLPFGGMEDSFNNTPNTASGREENGTDPWSNAQAPKATILAAFILFGLAGNIFLIVTIFHTKRLRTTAFYIFIINGAVTNLLECLLNMTIILSTTISMAWNYGEAVCNLSCFFMNLICIEGVLCLNIFAADRVVAVRFREKYDHVISTPRFSILIGYSWFHSAAFSVPIISGSVPSAVYDNIYYCTITKGSTVIYLCFAALFCFLAPLIVLIVFYVYIIRTSFKERFVVRALLAQNNYNEDSREEPKIRKEVRYSKLSGTLFIVWLVLVGPYAVTSYFSQFQYSSELESVNSEDLTYIWHVDLVLLWLRFSYTLALPICAFLWDKDLWKYFKDIILCRKNNAILDASDKKEQRHNKQDAERKMKEEEKMKEAFAQNTVFQVPVLFATSRGVHIQTCSDQQSDSEIYDSQGNIRGKKCDVIGSRDNLNLVEEDTSDYDSGNEMDPFSISHPVSVKHLKQNQQLNLTQRSSSQPEVGGRKKSETSGTITPAGDSGLDLSSGTMLFKKTNSVPLVPEVKSEHSPIQKSDSDSGVLCSGSGSTSSDDQAQGSLKSSKHTQIPTGQSKTQSIMNQETVQENGENSRGKSLGSQENEESDSLNMDVTATHRTQSRCTQEELDTVTSSPSSRRKKKKKKQSQSRDTPPTSVTSSPLLPPRPPPRLAPIPSNPSVRNLYAGIDSRPGSRTSFSSQCSVLDGTFDSVQTSLTVVNTCGGGVRTLPSEITPVKKKRAKRKSREYKTLKDNEMAEEDEFENTCRRSSVTSILSQVSNKGVNVGSNVEPNRDFSRQMNKVQEEVLISGDCHRDDPFTTNTDLEESEGYSNLSDQDHSKRGITNYAYNGSPEEGNPVIPTLLTAEQYRHGNAAVTRSHKAETGASNGVLFDDGKL